MVNASIECKLLSRHSSDPADLSAAYKLWKESWFSLFSEIQQPAYMNSDEFLRQDTFLCVFHNEVCVALAGLRTVDLTRPYSMDDSYINVLPGNFLQNAQLESKFITVISGFNVNRQYQTRVGGLPTICLFGSLVMKYLKHFDIKNAVSITRNDAGMNKLAYKLNALPLVTDLPFHGKECDIVWFKYDEINDNPWPKYGEAFQTIFNGALTQPSPSNDRQQTL